MILGLPASTELACGCFRSFPPQEDASTQCHAEPTYQYAKYVLVPSKITHGTPPPSPRPHPPNQPNQHPPPFPRPTQIGAVVVATRRSPSRRLSRPDRTAPEVRDTEAGEKVKNGEFDSTVGHLVATRVATRERPVGRCVPTVPGAKVVILDHQER